MNTRTTRGTVNLTAAILAAMACAGGAIVCASCTANQSFTDLVGRWQPTNCSQCTLDINSDGTGSFTYPTKDIYGNVLGSGSSPVAVKFDPFNRYVLFLPDMADAGYADYLCAGCTVSGSDASPAPSATMSCSLAVNQFVGQYELATPLSCDFTRTGM